MDFSLNEEQKAEYLPQIAKGDVANTAAVGESKTSGNDYRA